MSQLPVFGTRILDDKLLAETLLAPGLPSNFTFLGAYSGQRPCRESDNHPNQEYKGELYECQCHVDAVVHRFTWRDSWGFRKGDFYFDGTKWEYVGDCL